MPMRNAAAQTLAAPARHVGRRRREQDGFPCDPKAAHRIRVSTAGPARSRVRILRSRVSHDRAALQYRSLYLLAPPSMQNRTRQRARRRPWTALAGSAVGLEPAKARMAASGQIWGSWSDAGAAGKPAADQSTVPQRVLRQGVITTPAPAACACACVTNTGRRPYLAVAAGGGKITALRSPRPAKSSRKPDHDQPRPSPIGLSARTSVFPVGNPFRPLRLAQSVSGPTSDEMTAALVGVPGWSAPSPSQ